MLDCLSIYQKCNVPHRCNINLYFPMERVCVGRLEVAIGGGGKGDRMLVLRAFLSDHTLYRFLK